MFSEIISQLLPDSIMSIILSQPNRYILKLKVDSHYEMEWEED